MAQVILVFLCGQRQRLTIYFFSSQDIEDIQSLYTSGHEAGHIFWWRYIYMQKYINVVNNRSTTVFQKSQKALEVLWHFQIQFSKVLSLEALQSYLCDHLGFGQAGLIGRRSGPRCASPWFGVCKRCLARQKQPIFSKASAKAKGFLTKDAKRSGELYVHWI